MSTGKRRVFTREVKLSAIQRVLAGESGAAVCRELKIGRSHLSLWCAQYRRHGPEGLRLARRPLKVHGVVELDPLAKAMRAKDLGVARKYIAELEGKVGQQQVELDFFRRALRNVGEARQPSDGPGVPASTPPSRR
jgi:transposase-like protein